LKIKDQFFENFAAAKKENIFCCQIFLLIILDIVTSLFRRRAFFE